MMLKVIVSAVLLVSLAGTDAQFPGPNFAAYSSPQWRSRLDSMYLGSGRQQYQNNMAPSNADPIDKLMNYLNYATPSSSYPQNYKLSLDSGLHYRPNEKYRNPQDRHRDSTIAYAPAATPDASAISAIAGAVGIKIPIEINVRDVFNAILKFGQSVGAVKVDPMNSNMFTLVENHNSDKVQSDYNIQKPSGDGSSPSNVIQFNIIKLDGSRVAEARPDQETRPSPGPAQTGFEPRPEYPQSDCGSHSHHEQMGPQSRFMEEPLPYWVHRPY